MENVCKACGVILLKNQKTCPCCGAVKTFESHHDPMPYPEVELNDSLRDPFIADRHAGY
ncbi:hypothetical protein SAMN02746065_101202 [Desulfocicer vacuolatum DSM 3385]|uniref:Uncharacterized protein n=1 Tax=Desulfocicer vacuolatum DSM 3385 TaxID=1121400 RepID=A0A1W1YP44_9BACT|nr:hypothetical protein [Desulfocicer vacuolatum]SMC37508.1 hypothetical protein SAMN02746065_101202 [Desulfocicer vacuolatum DSM 3385]